MKNGNKRVLVVDDGRFVRRELSAIISMKGFVVDSVEDGIKALKQIEDGEFDLILLDLTLPGISGVETLERILRINPFANVMVMTAYSDQAVIAKAMSEGAKRCFLKPMDIETIEEVLKDVMPV